jgi:hypothetical protein
MIPTVSGLTFEKGQKHTLEYNIQSGITQEIRNIEIVGIDQGTQRGKNLRAQFMLPISPLVKKDDDNNVLQLDRKRA